MLEGLLISYEDCPPDVATLVVAKTEADRIKIVNTLKGSVASELYHYLTGGAEMISLKEIAKKPIEIGKYGFGCPCCNGDLGLEEEDIYVYDMTPPKYCSNCGQKLDWE